MQQIEPEKRSAFIKATLRQVLLGENGVEEIRKDIISTDTTKKNSEHEQTKDHVDTFEEEIESFSLEALFTGASEQDGQLDRLGDQEFDFESLHVETPIPSSGFEYMMKHIIGTEEDEVVLKILRGGPEG